MKKEKIGFLSKREIKNRPSRVSGMKPKSTGK